MHTLGCGGPNIASPRRKNWSQRARAGDPELRIEKEAARLDGDSLRLARWSKPFSRCGSARVCAQAQELFDSEQPDGRRVDAPRASSASNSWPKGSGKDKGKGEPRVPRHDCALAPPSAGKDKSKGPSQKGGWAANDWQAATRGWQEWSGGSGDSAQWGKRRHKGDGKTKARVCASRSGVPAAVRAQGVEPGGVSAPRTAKKQRTD